MEEQIKTVEELLRIRESRGLRVPVTFRILFSLYGVISALTSPMPSTTRLIVLCITTPFIVTNAYFLVLLRNATVKRVRLVGITGVVLDTITIFWYPFFIYYTFYNSSHEMNNPLGAVKANAQIWHRAINRIRDSLRKSAEGGRVNDRTERILDTLEQTSRGTLEATERIGATLKTLRSFARLDEAEFKLVDIHEALDSTLALIPPETVGNARVLKQYGDLPGIRAYARRLNQVFMTLLTNAFKAIEGDGTVTITTKSEEKEVTIHINDTGEGISAEEKERIFDIRLEAGESRVEAGFGMAACHSIVKQHRGQILVESSSGKGTTYTIVFPILSLSETDNI